MNPQLEENLRRALAEEAAELPADATARLLALDYRPRGPITRALFPILTACLVVAVAIVVLALRAGTDASRAFAGWSATPTGASRGQVARADAACRSQLKMTRRRAHEAPAAPGPASPLRELSARAWRTVLTDTRGPYTMIVLEAGAGRAVAACFADRHFQTSIGMAIGVRPPAPVARGHVALASSGSTTTPSDEGSRRFSQVVGRTGAGVTGVTIRLTNGTHVRASSANGWFLAWWPGSHGLAATEVTRAPGD